MIKTRIAKRYAGALFELAEEAGRVEEVGRDLGLVESLIDTDPAVRDGVTSPVVGREQKSQLLEAVIEAAAIDITVANFLRVLLDARKLALVPQIAEQFNQLADEATGRVRGVAASPIALDEAELKGLADSLSKALGKEVVLESVEDSELIGGVVAKVGNLVFDGSVKTQLERMKESLIKG